MIAVRVMGSPHSINLFTARKMVQGEYEACLARGCSPRLAEMLVLQQAPSLQTDTRWSAGRHSANQWQNTPQIGEAMRRKGVKVSGSAFYSSQLARYPGDPEAVVETRSDVRRLCEKRGMSCEGSVNVKARDVEVDSVEGPYRVADDLVDKYSKEEIRKNPDAARDPELKTNVRKRLEGA